MNERRFLGFLMVVLIAVSFGLMTGAWVFPVMAGLGALAGAVGKYRISVSSRREFYITLMLAVVFCQACSGNSIVFRDITKETGITFRHTDGSSGERYIVETVASGLALFDYDNDGQIDVDMALNFVRDIPVKFLSSCAP